MASEEEDPLIEEDTTEYLLDRFDHLVINKGYWPEGFNLEAYMAANGWKKMDTEWLARVHKNGKGASWMHLCPQGNHWHLARRTEAGRVRCKNCGKMLDEGPQMVMELQKLKGIR